jgi:hypothetical protein
MEWSSKQAESMKMMLMKMAKGGNMLLKEFFRQ